MPIDDRDLTLALGHKDYTFLDIELSYYPTVPGEEMVITPRVQPFVLKDGPRPRIQTFWINESTPYLLRFEVFPTVKYICIMNREPAPPVDNMVAKVSWTDNISGDFCMTSLDSQETLVIPNPRKYDADLDLYGVEVTTEEEEGDILIYIAACGSES